MSKILPKTEHKYLGNDKILSEFFLKLSDLRAGKSSLMLINGSKGIGKSRLLKEMEIRAETNQHFTVSYQVNQPTGNIALVDLSPYTTFAGILEAMAKNKKNAKLQLFQSISLTILASLPFAGEVFYAGKEISKDLKEYNKTNNSDKTNENFLEVFEKVSKKKSMVIFIDDFHFADTHSSELLGLLIKKLNENKMRILFVVTFDKSSHIRQFFTKKISSFQQSESVSYYSLKPFTNEQITEAVHQYFPNESITNEVQNWFITKTNGNPLAIYKYLEYFTERNIKLNSILTEEKNQNIPNELHGLFLSNIMKLSESEMNLLSHCALIGYEFPVTLVAELMKTDLLTIIRRLRAIQNLTGIIVSVGVRTVFGEKATHFQFTQPLYAEQFIEQLEYEEKREMKLIITQLYKKLYDKTDDINVKNSIMPYLLSHAQETEDKNLIQEIISNHKDQAEISNSEISKEALKNFMNDLHQKVDEELPETDSTTEVIQLFTEENQDEESSAYPFYPTDYEYSENLQKITESADAVFSAGPGMTWEQLLEFSLNPVGEETISKIEDFIKKTSNENEKLKANLLLAKILTSTEKYEKAREVLSRMNFKLNSDDPSSIDILYINTKAILDYKNGNYESAISQLQEGARLALRLAPEFKLLTLSNIALVLQNQDKVESKKYYTQVVKQAKLLNYEAFLVDFEKNYNLIN